MARRLRVGVLELLAYTVASEWAWLPGVAGFKRQFASIMPQAVSAWARQMGHRVTYATWYGQADPVSLLPDDLDVVLVATSTQGSALAYALARVFRTRGVRSVIGGPHAACYPQDCARFFDVTVTQCDRALLADLLAGDAPRGSILASAQPPSDIPSVEDRLPEIAVSAFTRGRPGIASIIPLYASTGCPYDCGFCTDWDSTYVQRPREALAADLAFVAARFPGTLLGFHDPNFGIRLDETLDVLETVPPDRRSRYLMQCSMGLLTPARQRRLAQTGCLYVAPGIESWTGFGRKLRMGGAAGADLVGPLAEAFTALRQHVRGLQANFVLGLETDEGDAPFALTRDFLERVPFVWPNINIATPYGGTPLHADLARQGRLLRAMPLALHCSPYLAMLPRHYDAPEFYARLVALMEASVALPITLRRLVLCDPAAVRLARISQTVAVRRDIAEMRIIRDLLKDDAAMRDFHAGRSAELPPYYRQQLALRLGRYGGLLAARDLVPAQEAPPPARRHAASRRAA